MAGARTGEVAVIFTSRRTAADDEGYAEAAEAMAELAAAQPGYRGVASARDADRLGITVSYWADEASAVAWRNHPDHVRIRNAGRDRWYESYEVVVTKVTRDYCWSKG